MMFQLSGQCFMRIFYTKVHRSSMANAITKKLEKKLMMCFIMKGVYLMTIRCRLLYYYN